MATNNDNIFAEDPSNKVVSVARNKVTVVLSQALNDGDDIDTGFMVYEDSGSAQPLASSTWETLSNDGAGSDTLKAYGPQNVGNLLNVSTGAIDFSELSVGDTLLISVDGTFTPSANNVSFESQILLGSGGSKSVAGPIMFLPTSGVAYRVCFTFLVPITGSDVQSNPGTVQARVSQAGSLTMSSTTLQLINRFG